MQAPQSSWTQLVWNKPYLRDIVLIVTASKRNILQQMSLAHMICLPSNQDELARQSTPARVYRAAVCRDKGPGQAAASLETVHESSESNRLLLLHWPPTAQEIKMWDSTYPFVVVHFLQHATEELLNQWHLAELIFYSVAILISLWLTCKHRTWHCTCSWFNRRERQT